MTERCPYCTDAPCSCGLSAPATSPEPFDWKAFAEKHKDEPVKPCEAGPTSPELLDKITQTALSKEMAEKIPYDHAINESTSPGGEPASCPSCGLPEKHFPYGAQYCPDKWHESPGGEPAPQLLQHDRGHGHVDYAVQVEDGIIKCPSLATAEKIVSLHKENADLRRQVEQLEKERDEAQEDALKAIARAGTAERQLASIEGEK